MEANYIKKVVAVDLEAEEMYVQVQQLPKKSSHLRVKVQRWFGQPGESLFGVGVGNSSACNRTA